MDCTNYANITVMNDFAAGIVGSSDSGTVFNCVNNAMVKGNSRSGGIVGRNNGSISNCMSTKEATIQGEYLVGGIAGINENSNTITDCYNVSPVTSTGGSDFDGSAVGKGAYTGGIART